MCIRSVHNIISIIIEWKYGFVKFFFHYRKKLLIFVNYTQRCGRAAGCMLFSVKKMHKSSRASCKKEKNNI